MKQYISPASTATTRKKTFGTSAPRSKAWSVKVNLRLPHKVGQPLGSTSSGSDGCGE